MAKYDSAVLAQIDSIELSDRLASFRERFFDEKPGVTSERITLAMESCRETEGEPVSIRSAKKLKRIAENISVVIHPGELLVGSPTRYFRGADPYCDFDGSYLEAPMAEDRITLGGPVEERVITP